MWIPRLHHPSLTSSWTPLLILSYSYRLLQKYQCNLIERGVKIHDSFQGNIYNHKPDLEVTSLTRSVSVSTVHDYFRTYSYSLLLYIIESLFFLLELLSWPGLVNYKDLITSTVMWWSQRMILDFVVVVSQSPPIVFCYLQSKGYGKWFLSSGLLSELTEGSHSF